MIELRQHQEPSERWSLVRTDTALISSCFPKTWTGTTVLSITRSLLLRIRKLVCCKLQSLRIDALIRRGNHPLHSFPCPLSITITSIPYQYHQKTSHAPMIFHDMHLPVSFCFSSFSCLIFETNFLGCILSFQIVGSRAIFLNLNIHLFFRRFNVVQQYSGQYILFVTVRTPFFTHVGQISYLGL